MNVHHLLRLQREVYITSGLLMSLDWNRYSNWPIISETTPTAPPTQLSGNVDIGLSHDWPLGIYHHGNKAQLLRKKPYFAEEVSVLNDMQWYVWMTEWQIENETLGSPAAMELLRHMKPDFWFSAHLHVKFAAVYRHDDDTTGRITKFLALDKCLPGRRYLQVSQ